MRLAWWWRKLQDNQLTRSLVAKPPQHSLLVVLNSHTGYSLCTSVHKPCQMSWHLKHIMIAVVYVSSPTIQTVKQTYFELLHNARILNGGWLHRGPYKTTKPSKLGDGCLHRNGCLFGTIIPSVHS